MTADAVAKALRGHKAGHTWMVPLGLVLVSRPHGGPVCAS
jgi:hypothetical protein